VSAEDVTDQICDICRHREAVSQCCGCSRALCKRCRNMEIYVQGDGEVTIKYFCPSCSQDPRVNPPMACKKVFGLEDVTDMVNQEDSSKSGRFKIKLKIT